MGLALILMVGAQAWAQGRQYGNLRGTAKDATDSILPGVTIEVTSEALQGTRTTVTDLNGNYQIVGLPPGQYSASFALQNFATVDRQFNVEVGRDTAVNVAMPVGGVREAVDVLGAVPTPLTETEISQNITGDRVDTLPMARDLFSIAELAPGLTANTVTDGQIAINGSSGYDNIYLIDGVDINDNLLGTANDLFIEDAIDETQILTSGISAEYGRFSGGVVNAITKSGGNRFSGSFRANLFKPDWTARTPFEIENDNDRTGTLADNTTYETTVGGPIVRDRLWFFYANRRQRESADDTLPVSGASFVRSVENDRNLIKLTGSIAPGHTLEGSYLRNMTNQVRPSIPSAIDPATLTSPEIPNDLWVATYRGAVNSSLFIEGRVSRREFGSRNQGGTLTAAKESPFLSVFQGTGLDLFNAPAFDSNDPEDRNNRQVTASATYFLPTELGTHSIKGGFEHFQSTRTTGGSQSATSFIFIAPYAENPDGSPLLDADGRFVPLFGAPAPFFPIRLEYFPVLGASIDINTLSFYVNDSWAVNDHVSVNLGVRAEKITSDATDSLVGLDTSAAVPRLSLGDGRFTFQTTYSHYVGKYSESQFARNTIVGIAPELEQEYIGPPGQGRNFAPGFDDANYETVGADFPTQNVFFEDGLKSPRTKEFTVSGGAALGTRGYAKVTYINRRASDFVEDFVTLDGGSTTVTGNDGEEFGTFSNLNFRNTDALERNYDGLEFQGRFQATNAFLIDGSYTVQINNDGNFEGEARSAGAISSNAFDYPEVTPANRYYPTGRLKNFQRH